MSKPKISDIAREAGVSCATVSYVLNNNPHQKINENTRKKILQIASLLGYTKNVYASALAGGKTNLIGIYSKTSSFPLKAADTYGFLKKLTISLKKEGYTVVLLSDDYTENINFVDAIVAIDVSEEDFKTICNNVYIPVVAVDTKPHEDWIFSLCRVYHEIDSSEQVIVTLKGNSAYHNEQILVLHPNTIFISNYSDFECLRNEEREIISTSEVLSSYLKFLNIPTTSITDITDDIITKIIELLKHAQEHEDAKTHLCKI